MKSKGLMIATMTHIECMGKSKKQLEKLLEEETGEEAPEEQKATKRELVLLIIIARLVREIDRGVEDEQAR